MGVDNDIGSYTFARKRQIFLTVGDTNCTLLTMSRGELISHLRYTRRSNTHLDELSTFAVRCNQHLVDNTALSACLLYKSDAADDMQCVDLGGRRIIKKNFFQAEDGIRDSP